MDKIVLKVDGMSCEHCVKAVTNEVSALPGIGKVAVDLNTGSVTVEFDPALSTLDKIKAAIEDQGYDVLT